MKSLAERVERNRQRVGSILLTYSHVDVGFDPIRYEDATTAALALTYLLGEPGNALGSAARSMMNADHLRVRIKLLNIVFFPCLFTIIIDLD